MADFIPNQAISTDSDVCRLLTYLSRSESSQIEKRILFILNQYRHEALTKLEFYDNCLLALESQMLLNLRPEKSDFKRSLNNLSNPSNS